ncbi:nanos homolog 2-like [Melanotaenia boesemani]|uniref:nanos homolog 2-like n=1 Tax=Melanotaenia boesemani TaxID=1250792 RepID=UPI001C03DC39|nr:nanos homolog 2-like [Melanotaenia boesemani]
MLFLTIIITMQRRVDIQDAPLYSGYSFDMWHDYMDLSKVLEKLCYPREEDSGDPKKELSAMQWSYIKDSSLRKFKLSKSSAESSSASSLSDTSSGTHTDYCRFCKQNGESSRVYWSHTLKSDNGKVTCPILRNYICPICEATGDHAHTRRYCPQAQRRDDASTPGFESR